MKQKLQHQLILKTMIFKCGEGEGPTEVRFPYFTWSCGEVIIRRWYVFGKGNRKNPCGIINILYLDYDDWSMNPCTWLNCTWKHTDEYKTDADIWIRSVNCINITILIVILYCSFARCYHLGKAYVGSLCYLL